MTERGTRAARIGAALCAAVVGLLLTAGCEKSTKTLPEEEPAPEGPATATEGDKPPSAETDAAPSAATEPNAPPEVEAPRITTTREKPARPDPEYRYIAFDDITRNDELRGFIVGLKQTGRTKSLRAHFERLKPDGSIRALIAALRAPDGNVRSQAATILNRMKHRSRAMTDELNRVLLSDPDPDVRGVIAHVMVYYKDRRTVPALIEALGKDEAEAVRMNAAWALGAMKDRRGRDALVGALDDDKTDVRLRAVRALQRMRAKRAVPWLVGRLEDPNQMVRERALEALRELTGKRFGADIGPWRRAYPAPEERDD